MGEIITSMEGAIRIKQRAFRDEVSRIMEDYSLTYENDSDLPQMVGGLLFYHDDNFLIHIRGISYDRNGYFVGDLDGFVSELKKAVSTLKPTNV